MSKSVQVHRVEAILTKDGTLTIDNLPFQAGDLVEVIVRLNDAKLNRTTHDTYPLRGRSVTYDRPFDPVDVDAIHCIA